MENDDNFAVVLSGALDSFFLLLIEDFCSIFPPVELWCARYFKIQSIFIQAARAREFASSSRWAQQVSADFLHRSLLTFFYTFLFLFFSLCKHRHFSHFTILPTAFDDQRAAAAARSNCLRSTWNMCERFPVWNCGWLHCIVNFLSDCTQVEIYVADNLCCELRVKCFRNLCGATGSLFMQSTFIKPTSRCS